MIDSSIQHCNPMAMWFNFQKGQRLGKQREEFMKFTLWFCVDIIYIIYSCGPATSNGPLVTRDIEDENKTINRRNSNSQETSTCKTLYMSPRLLSTLESVLNTQIWQDTINPSWRLNIVYEYSHKNCPVSIQCICFVFLQETQLCVHTSYCGLCSLFSCNL